MTFNAPSYSDSPRNSTNYLGQNYRYTPTYIRKRNPVNGTSLTNLGDIKPKENQGRYPIGSLWINTSNPPEIWILSAITSTGAQWVLIANSLIQGPLLTLSDNSGTVVSPSSDVSNPPGNIQFLNGTGMNIVAGTNSITFNATGAGNETLTGDDGVAVSPSAGTIQTIGNVVANSTHAKALFTTNSAANIERFDIQLSAAIGSTNVAKVGLAAFSSAQFAVDANGFVTLTGGGTPPALGLTPDAHTAPGTSPVVPNGSGNIIIEGGVMFATGTQANPIRTNSLAANTLDLQIQLAGSNAAVSTANNFGVAQFDSNSFTVASGFVTLNNAGTTGPVTKLLGDDGGANSVVPSSGTITLDGITVANATNAKPVFFKKNAASVEELDVQLTTTSTSGAKNINKSGLAHFDSASFTVDAATGFVSLGVSSIVTNLVGDDTLQVVPNGSQNIILDGLTVANSTHAKPVFFAKNGTNTEELDIQLSAAIASTNVNKVGLAAFNSNDFTVDANGFVSLIGGATSPALTKLGVDAVTSGTNPTVPDATGLLTLTGAQVATGTVGANVIRFVGTAANVATAQIQRSTSAAASNSTLNGVCHFDSSKFGVDTNGFVTFTGSTSNIPWSDQGGNFNASSNNGYFCTALLTATLPATPAQGDVVKIIVDTTSAVTVTGNTGQKIRVNNALSASAGTAVSTARGNTLELYYRSSSATWFALASEGTWTVT